LHGEVVALGVLIFCYIRDKDIELTKLLLKKFNISVVFQELGINKESIIKALMHSSNEGLKKKRYTILQDIDNSYDNFEAIVNKMINGKFLKEFSS
jgi:glycerol dehydrogenase-like iron-containing ADH family enzyme